MTRERVGSALCLLTAVLLLVTAAFHHTGFGYVSRLASDAAPELRPLVPPVAGVLRKLDCARADRRSYWPQAEHGAAGHATRYRALFPAAAAALQIRYIGFMLPTAILFTDAAVAVAAAVLLESRPAMGPAG